jgi:hypothetical protein
MTAAAVHIDKGYRLPLIPAWPSRTWCHETVGDWGHALITARSRDPEWVGQIAGSGGLRRRTHSPSIPTRVISIGLKVGPAAPVRAHRASGYAQLPSRHLSLGNWAICAPSVVSAPVETKRTVMSAVRTGRVMSATRSELMAAI